jgi:hypothetical protein
MLNELPGIQTINMAVMFSCFSGKIKNITSYNKVGGRINLVSELDLQCNHTYGRTEEASEERII